MKFRKLRADEIECRVQSNKETWAILLLYKTARTDANLLDEMGLIWENDFKVINDNLYGGIGIYDETLNRMVWKWDCGVESNQDAAKGEASDAFKRAGFKWGIGRELYTAPMTIVTLTPDDFKNGKLKTRFNLLDIAYDGDNISRMVIVDDKGNIRFSYGTGAAPVEIKKQAKKSNEKTLLEKAQELNINLDKLAVYLKKTVDDLTNEDIRQAIEMKEAKRNGRN